MSADLVNMARVAASLLGTCAARGGEAYAGDEAAGVSPYAVYDAEIVPAISLDAYVARWSDYSETGERELLAAVIYVDRLCAKTGLHLSQRNVHRILLVALLAATKMQEDISPFRMSHYAEVGGVALDELARLETCFLCDMEWDLVVSERAAARYQDMLRSNPAWAAPPPSARRIRRAPRRQSSSASSAASCGSISSEGTSVASAQSPATSLAAPSPREEPAPPPAAKWLSRIGLARKVRRAMAPSKKTGTSF